MGCDIHLYIEYKRKGFTWWFPFGGCFRLTRDYSVFARLAGVRNYENATPVAAEKGVPDDMGRAADSDYWLFICDTEGEGRCTPEQASRYVADGARYSDDRSFVSHPDWHSHSWLTPDEFASAISLNADVEYRAVLVALRAFEAAGMLARVVFWFDN